MDSSLLLIDPVVAVAYKVEELLSGGVIGGGSGGGLFGGNDGAGGQGRPPVGRPGDEPVPPVTARKKKRFYGTIELDPVLAKTNFNNLVDEVLLQFTVKPGVNVKLTVEIEADTDAGFDDSLQRAVKENCSVLGFKSAEFDE